MSDRIAGLFACILALAFFASALQLETPFFPDPLGPKAFPILISIVGFIAGFMMVLKPDEEPKWPVRSTMMRLLIAVLILVGYAISLKPLGFLVPTAFAAGLLCFQISSNSRSALSTGIGISSVLFLIFKYGLGLSLFALPRWLVN